MHHVDQLLEQNETTWGDPDAGTNHNAAELLALKSARDNRYGRLTKVCKT